MMIDDSRITTLIRYRYCLSSPRKNLKSLTALLCLKSVPVNSAKWAAFPPVLNRSQWTSLPSEPFPPEKELQPGEEGNSPTLL